MNRRWKLAIVILGIAAWRNGLADLNKDDTLDSLDVGILMSQWGPGTGSADLNLDGNVDAADLVILLGQEVNPLLVGLADNTALDLGTYTCAQVPGEYATTCRAITDYSGFAYDPLGQQMLMFGGGHASTMRDDVDVFSFEDLGWGSAYASTPCDEMTPANHDDVYGRWITTDHPHSRHTYDLLVVAPATGELVMLSPGWSSGGQICAYFTVTGDKVAHYDIANKSWSFGGDTVWPPYSSSALDPVSGRIVIVSGQGLYTYDPVSRTGAQHLDYSNDAMSYAKNMVYFPPNDRFYYIAQGDAIFEIALDRADFDQSTVTEVSGIGGDVPDLRETGFAYDTVNHLIGGGVRGGVFYAYDPLTRQWHSRGIRTSDGSGDPGSVAYHALDYDPVNNVYIYITDSASGEHTWAYRYDDGVP
jgi:hypothetical protein